MAVMWLLLKQGLMSGSTVVASITGISLAMSAWLCVPFCSRRPYAALVLTVIVFIAGLQFSFFLQHFDSLQQMVKNIQQL